MEGTLARKVATIRGYNVKVSKDLNNPFLKTKYAGLHSINRALDPLLIDHKLGVKFVHKGNTTELIVTCLDSLESESSWLDMAPKEPQPMGATITYYRRYLLMSYFNLTPTDDLDDDANQTVKWLNKDSPDWEKVKRAINDKKVKSLQDIRKHYGINKTIEPLLVELLDQQK